MRSSLLLLGAAIAVATSSVAAQTNTSPRGLDSKEGNATFFHWGGTARRLQGIDQGWVGQPRVIRSIAWRRDGAGGGGSRTLDAKVTMGECFFGQIHADFALNLQTNVSQVVSATMVNFPDWSAPANPPPGPFDFVLTFTRPWVYTGRAAIVWDVEYANSSTSTGGTMDRDYTGATTTPSGTVLGTGCSGYAHDMRLENSGPALPNFSMRFRFNGTGGPANAPTILMVDTQDRNLASRDLCGTLHCLPNLLINVGTTDAAGQLTYRSVSFPYFPGLQSVTFVTQLASLDAAQAPKLPFRLSTGSQAVMPANAATTGHEAVYLWSPLPSNLAISNLTFFGGSVIVELKI